MSAATAVAPKLRVVPIRTLATSMHQHRVTMVRAHSRCQEAAVMTFWVVPIHLLATTILQRQLTMEAVRLVLVQDVHTLTH